MYVLFIDSVDCLVLIANGLCCHKNLVDIRCFLRRSCPSIPRDYDTEILSADDTSRKRQRFLGLRSPFGLLGDF